MELGNDTNSTVLGCIEHIKLVNEDLEPYETLRLLVPTNDDAVWIPRSRVWDILFTVAISTLALAYLVLGLAALVMIVKKNCLVIPTHTFFAIYFSLAILGLSRAMLFVLDPYGILGFISRPFPGWIIISRFLGSVGFPSLVGSCTLIILTLVKLVNVTSGRQWYERWRYVLVVTATPYVIALTAEALGHINTYTALFSGLICEAFFVIWGLVICSGYLVAGNRLLRKIHKLGKRTRTELNKNERKKGRIKRKIVRITFGTAAAGIFYSLVSAGSVTMLLLLIFSDCMGRDDRRTDSRAWLVIQIITYLAEILLALLLFYSITDVPHLFHFLCKLLPFGQRLCDRPKCPAGHDCDQDVEDPENGTNSMERQENGNLCVQQSGPTVVQGLGNGAVCSTHINGVVGEFASETVEIDFHVQSLRDDVATPLETDEHHLERFTIETGSGSSTDTVGYSQPVTTDTTPVSGSSNGKRSISCTDVALERVGGGRERRRESVDTDIVSRVFSIGGSPPPPPEHSNKKRDRNRKESAPALISRKYYNLHVAPRDLLMQHQLLSSSRGAARGPLEGVPPPPPATHQHHLRHSTSQPSSSVPQEPTQALSVDTHASPSSLPPPPSMLPPPPPHHLNVQRILDAEGTFDRQFSV